MKRSIETLPRKFGSGGGFLSSQRAADHQH
jgi:hypothetical protein